MISADVFSHSLRVVKLTEVLLVKPYRERLDLFT